MPPRLPSHSELLVPPPAGMQQGRTPSGKPSQTGWSELFPKWDLHQPAQFRAVTRNLVVAHDLTSQHFPQAYQEGKIWHEKEHEGIQRSLRGAKGKGLTEWHGAGIAAAVSAGSDWEGENVHALSHALKMPKKHWDMIMRAHAQGHKKKTSEIQDFLRGGPLESVTLANLHRAGQIRAGRHPLEIINPKTSPKEYYFTHSLAEPDKPHPATIDFRAHDIAINRMYPALYSGRGVQSAHAATGVATRYERFTHGYEAAGHMRDIELPHQMQAITWLGGKKIETLPPTARGHPRQKGVPRRGQPYFHQGG